MQVSQCTGTCTKGVRGRRDYAGHTREVGRLGKKHVGGMEPSADDEFLRRSDAPPLPLVTESNGGQPSYTVDHKRGGWIDR